MARKDPSESTSFKGLPEVGDFGDRLALLLAFADWLSWITERTNGQYFQFIRDAQDRKRRSFPSLRQLPAVPTRYRAQVSPISFPSYCEDSLFTRTSVSKSLRHQRIAKATTIAILRSYYLFGSPGLTDTLERGQIAKEVAKVMTVLLIEPILDRYVAQAERREKDWSPKEVEALLLKLRKEILDCLK